jgi:hypothetical protein
LRLAELDGELRQTQARVYHLESQLEDARLAHLMGDREGGNPDTIKPELERSRGSLESQQAVVESVKKSQWKARVEYTMLRAKQHRETKHAEAAEAGEAS